MEVVKSTRSSQDKQLLGGSMLSDKESAFLGKLDSRGFGFLSLGDMFDVCQTVRNVVEKGIKFRQLLAANSLTEIDSVEHFCKLGHLHLLLEEFPKALSSYQKCLQLQRDLLKSDVFLYGLGMVYFHFNAFDWAIRSFQQVLIIDANFSHSTEVHLRLAIMYKVTNDFGASLKHFRQALSRWNYCSLIPLEVQFHIAHLFEVQGNLKAAMDTYEKILESPNGSSEFRASVYCQLGWLYHFSDNSSDKSSQTAKAIEQLQKSVELNRASWVSWYYLGRCFAVERQSYYAFMSYRQSIERNESSPDTWCSIGVLYQQQAQMADALQAYICAVQLDSQHAVGWIDLGILYESSSQLRDALKCYHQALSCMQASNERTSLESRVRTLYTLSQVFEMSDLPKEKFLISTLGIVIVIIVIPCMCRTLPTLREAFSLPIPLELVERAYRKGLIKDRPVCPSTPDYSDCMPPSEVLVSDSAVMKLVDSPVGGFLSSTALNLSEPKYAPYRAQGLPAASKWSQHHGTCVPATTPQPHGLSMNLSFRTNPETVCVEQLNSDGRKVTNLSLNAHGPASSSEIVQPHPAVSESQQHDAFVDPQLSPAKPTIQQKVQSTHPDTQHQNSCIGADFVPIRPESTSSELFCDMDIPSSEPLPDISAAVTDMFCPVSESEDFSPLLPGTTSPLRGLQTVSVLPGTTALAGEPMGSFPSVPSFDLLGGLGHVPCSVPSWIDSTNAASSYCIVDESEYMQQTPMAPPKPPSECLNLHPDVPMVEVKSPYDGHSPVLKRCCWNPKNPIVLICSLAQAVNIDLNIFSSKSLTCANEHHPMDVRIQRKQTGDQNWDLSGKQQVWTYESTRSETTIGEYAHYQEQYYNTDTTSFDSGNVPAGQLHQSQILFPANDPEGQSKVIKFATNGDLSDEIKWAVQLAELQKLPEFMKVASEMNMLSYIDHTISGVNSVQLYMKVAGCRTPGHQENNNFCSVNLNVGPEDTEWFAVPNRYWGVLNSFCSKYKIDFLSGTWWPVLDDLEKEGVPVYRFLQRRGDLVWVNPGTPHWVQATGICNNVSWNVGPVTGHQYRMAMERYEWCKMRCVKSIVPMIHLSWNIARFVRVTDAILFAQLKECLTRSLLFCEYQMKRLKDEGIVISWHGRSDREPAHYCTVCQVEVFNILFVSSKNSKGEHYVLCEQCTRATDISIHEHKVLNQFTIEELKVVLNGLDLHCI